MFHGRMSALRSSFVTNTNRPTHEARMYGCRHDSLRFPAWLLEVFVLEVS